MREPVVYLIQEPTTDRIPRDLSSANRYGKIVSVLSAEHKPSLLPGPSLHEMRRVMKNFHPDDYILWIGGDPMGPLLAGYVMNELGYRSCKFLRWERERDLDGRRTGTGFYMPGTVQFRPEPAAAHG